MSFRPLLYLPTGLFALFLTATAYAQTAPQVVRVGGGTPATSIAKSQGFFAKQGLEVQLPRSSAGGSDEVRNGLAAGNLDLADYGADNAIAMAESGVDVIMVAASDYTPTVLVSQGDIKSLADLRGKTLLVDAPTTQNALALKRLLQTAGLGPNDYQFKEGGGTVARIALMKKDKTMAATMASGGTAIQARQDGFNNIASTSDIFGPVLHYGLFTTRQWAKDHSDLLVRYLTAHIQAQRWLMDPANKDKVIAFTAEERKMSKELAAQSYATDMSADGLAKDAALDMPRFNNMLRFRAEIEGTWGGKPPAPDRYIDLSYYQKALALANSAK